MVTRRRFIGGLTAAGVVVAAGGRIPPAMAASTSWLTERGSNLRRGSATGEVAITAATIGSLRRRWTRGGPTVADTEALVRGSRVYIVTSSGGSPALLAARRTGDGSSVWTRTVPGRPRTPAIGTGRIFVYSETFGGSIVSPLVSAFDVDSGAPLWSVVPPFVPEAPLGGGLGVVDGKVVVAAGFTLSVLRATDGATVAQLDVANGDFDSNGGAAPMIDGNGTAWYGYKFLDTLAVPPSTIDPIAGPRHVGNRATSPVLAGDQVLIAAVANIDSFDQVTGAKSTLATLPTSTHHALAWDGVRLFAASRRSGDANALRVYDPPTGAVLWERPGAVTAPLAVNGMVVVGEDSAGVAAYRASNGVELARFPGTARGADPVVVNGQLLIGFEQGAVPAGESPRLSRFTP
jgi:hypothetical protein